MTLYLPARGSRVVLVHPAPDPADRNALTGTLESISRYGWHLVGVIAPERHLDALRLIVDGKADVVLTVRPEHVPAVLTAGNLTPGRTQLLPRPPAGEPAPAPAERRTQLVDRTAPRPIPPPSAESCDPVGPARSVQRRARVLRRRRAS